MGAFILAEVEPRWLSLDDAARYARIGKRRLVALVRAGQIYGYQDTEGARGIAGPPWIIDRQSIDQYHLQRGGSHPAAEAMLKAVGSLQG